MSSFATTQQQYSPPEFYDFKPFFTLQPVSETREKQLNCWSSLIIQYCSHNNLNRLDPPKFPLFRNSLLGRQLSMEGINAVTNKLIQTGNAEWEDQSKTGLRIILKSPESLAGDIYSWACKNDFIGTIFTVYELHSGDDYQDSGFHGTDPVILRRALGILEREAKCTVFQGVGPGEEGVKFNPIG